jgi:hypothetical protein
LLYSKDRLAWRAGGYGYPDFVVLGQGSGQGVADLGPTFSGCRELAGPVDAKGPGGEDAGCYLSGRGRLSDNDKIDGLLGVVGRYSPFG